jgi:hypothetical protein
MSNEKAMQEHVSAVAKRVRRARKAAEGKPEPLTAVVVQENVLSTFAYHCGVIMTEMHLNGFGLNVPGGESVYVTMKIVTRDADGSGAWDQVEVNGVCVGNRHAARDEYARLCAPVIAAAFAVK